MTSEKALGPMLRSHRHAAGLTLEELGIAAGVSARAISDMERSYSRRPQARTVDALAAALKLDEESRALLQLAARSGGGRMAAPRPGLCDLPPDVPDFAGRPEQIGWLAESVHTRPDVGSVSIVSGAPGLGKTALAVHSAHRIVESLRDGCFFLDLRGLDPHPVEPGHALFRLLKALGIREDAVPAGLEERQNLYRQLMREKNALVVLDNAAHEAQIRPLLPDPDQGTVWITSRRTLTGVGHARRLTLPPLSPAESVAMLTSIIGARSEEGRPGQMDGLAQMCGNLPLALRIAGNRLVSRPAWTVRTLSDRLVDRGTRLDRLSAGDLHVQAAFTLSYSQLSSTAQLVFRRLALVPGPDAGPELGAVLTGLPVHQVDQIMDELVELGLLVPVAGGRIGFHDLIRLYARKQLHDQEAEPDRLAAQISLRDWLLGTATAAGCWFEPDHGTGADYVDPGALVRIDSREAAQRWLTEENLNWLAAFHEAAEDGQHAAVIALAEAMHWFSDHWIYWGHWPEVYETSRSAARAAGDKQVEAVHLNYLSWALIACLRLPAASVEAALEAAALAREVGDRAQEAWAWRYAAQAQQRLEGDRPGLELSLTYTDRAIALLAETEDKEAYLYVLVTAGDILRELDRIPEALERLEQALALLSDPATAPVPHLAVNALVGVYLDLGRVHVQAGDWAAAEKSYRCGLSVSPRPNVPSLEGMLRWRLAQVLLKTGRTAEARAFLLQALDFLITANYPAGIDDVRRTLKDLPEAE
jgi:tetratricopeptide (TPR) repeat protein/transcriptional regulator with XRE-family HTH domain